MSQHLRTWWNVTTLEMFLVFHMIPRGLRIRKNPTFAAPDEFIQQWNDVLSDCLFKLIQLLISYEHKKLQEIDVNIYATQTSVENIMATKRNKFDHDTNDYISDKVYLWKRNAEYNRSKKFPRSILKRVQNKSNRSVTFSSSEIDTSGTDGERDLQHRGNATGSSSSSLPSFLLYIKINFF